MSTVIPPIPMSTVLPPVPSHIYPANLDHVYDAHTVILVVDLGFRVMTTVPLQLARIAMPRDEMAAAQAKGWLQEWFALNQPADDGWPFVMRSFKSVGGGRYEGEIWHPFGSISLNDQYLMTNLVQPVE